MCHNTEKEVHRVQHNFMVQDLKSLSLGNRQPQNPHAKNTFFGSHSLNARFNRLCVGYMQQHTILESLDAERDHNPVPQFS